MEIANDTTSFLYCAVCNLLVRKKRPATRMTAVCRLLSFARCMLRGARGRSSGLIFQSACR